MLKTELHIGIVGAGNFAAFAARAFLQLPGVSITAVTDINEKASRQFADIYGLLAYHDLEEMIVSENVDLVYISTPPFLHYEQSKAALLAGKHVICEKPAALKTAEAEELAVLAVSRGLLYVVNLMQRYNPLYETVHRIVEKKILGNFVHGFFENYASDENLHDDHWFWDESKSGGIFVEHGVHFFDLFSGWLGDGKIVNALQLRRPTANGQTVDRVQCTVLYRGGVLNFYHGFNQPVLLDRQEMRLQFEYGEITLYGWIPVKMKLHGILKKGMLPELQGAFSSHTEFFRDETQLSGVFGGRYQGLDFEDHLTMDYENPAGKLGLYQQMITDMLADQWSWIRDHSHTRMIDHRNAVESLRMAEEASFSAITF